MNRIVCYYYQISTNCAYDLRLETPNITYVLYTASTYQAILNDVSANYYGMEVFLIPKNFAVAPEKDIFRLWREINDSSLVLNYDRAKRQITNDLVYLSAYPAQIDILQQVVGMRLPEAREYAQESDVVLDIFDPQCILDSSTKAIAFDPFFVMKDGNETTPPIQANHSELRAKQLSMESSVFEEPRPHPIVI